MIDRPDIFVTLSTFAADSPEPLRLLESSGFRFAVNPHGRRLTSAEVSSLAAGARAVVAGVERYDAETLASMPDLKCISRCGAGVDTIDLTDAARRGIAVLNTPDEPTAAVAELTVGMLLALLRAIPETTAALRARTWTRITGRLLAGKVVGIVGLGRIGRRVAELLQPFGAEIVACDPNVDAVWADARGIRLVAFSDLLRMSDLVTLHAAGSRDHPMRIGAEEIRAMKPGALLLNLARGSMVDDHAVAQALGDGHLGGAGFDVFPDEPYTGPLCDAPRVVLSAHQATLTVETRTAMEKRAVENAVAWLRQADAR
jgi:D-3-phosphoglycerate dehydrogenase